MFGNLKIDYDKVKDIERQIRQEEEKKSEMRVNDVCNEQNITDEKLFEFIEISDALHHE